MPLWPGSLCAFIRVCVFVRVRACVCACVSQGHRWLYAGHGNHLLYAWLIINNLLRPAWRGSADCPAACSRGPELAPVAPGSTRCRVGQYLFTEHVQTATVCFNKATLTDQGTHRSINIEISNDIYDSRSIRFTGLSS